VPIGSSWAAGSWVDGSWATGSWADLGSVTTPLTIEDLNTVFVPHLWETLYDATPGDDVNTLLARDIPTMRADPDSQQDDVNTDYGVYLS
jgi:hypothetical protein